MTQDEIIEMARQAGYKHPDAVGQCEDFAYFDLEAFAKLVAAKEREACAKVCDDVTWEGPFKSAAVAMSNLIRARGEA